jgi:hypothetical protein
VIFLLLGCVTLLVLMGALGAFSKAQVASIKAFGFWVAAIGGLLLAAMLLLTGRGAIALAALGLLGPLLWSWIGEARLGGTRMGGRAGRGAPAGGARGSGRMTRAEAFEVLGLQPGASREDILAAHRRLMRAAHPDTGGSDWLAARINLARDTLLS